MDDANPLLGELGQASTKAPAGELPGPGHMPIGRSSRASHAIGGDGQSIALAVARQFPALRQVKFERVDDMLAMTQRAAVTSMGVVGNKAFARL